MINIIKSQPSPQCLLEEKEKTNGDYRCGEVLERLINDFHNKCYLCEEKAPSTLNVEHFKPHKNNIDLKFDWNNLFLACGHCNNTKLAKYETILDCTDNTQIIINLLQFNIKPFPKEKVDIKPLDSSIKTQETAELLNKIYNGTTDLKTFEGINIRDRLIKELIDFNKLLSEYFYEDGLSDQDKLILRNKIQQKLSPKTAFTAFKIWVIKNNIDLYNEFKDLIN